MPAVHDFVRFHGRELFLMPAIHVLARFHGRELDLADASMICAVFMDGVGYGWIIFRASQGSHQLANGSLSFRMMVQD